MFCVCVRVSQSNGGEKMGRVSQLMRMYEFVPKMYHDLDSSSDVGLAEEQGAGKMDFRAQKSEGPLSVSRGLNNRSSPHSAAAEGILMTKQFLTFLGNQIYL